MDVCGCAPAQADGDSSFSSAVRLWRTSSSRSPPPPTPRPGRTGCPTSGGRRVPPSLRCSASASSLTWRACWRGPGRRRRCACSDWCVSRQLWWGHQIPAYQVKLPGSAGQQEVSGRPSRRRTWPQVLGLLTVRPSVCLTGGVGLWAEPGGSAPQSRRQVWSSAGGPDLDSR